MRSRALADAVRAGATYAGTVVGAGFASGQEIAQFFASFGKAGLAGIAVATVLFAWLGGRLLEVGYRLRATAYHEAIYHVCGRRTALAIDWLSAAFLFVMLSVMVAGMATVGRDYFGLAFPVGLAAAGAVTAATVMGGVRGVAAANMMVTPLLVVCIVAVCLYSLVFHSAAGPGPLAAAPSPVSQPAPHWLLATVLYVSYNLMVGATVLVPLGATVPHFAARAGGGMLGGLILGGLATFLTLVVMVHFPHSLSQEVPILEVASRQHPLVSAVYTVLLLAAMYTTALASLYGCAGKMAAATGLHPAVAVPVVTAAAMVCGQLGFAYLIRVLFPVFGYVTVWFTVRLAWLSFRGNRWR